MHTFRSFLHDLTAMPRDIKLLALALFMWGAGESLYVYIVPLYMKDLGASPSEIGFIYGLGAAVLGLTMIPAGILADRWGRKQMLLLGWAIGTVAALLMALGGTLSWFAVGWVGYWLTGFVIPAMSSYVAAGRGPLPPERALTLTYAGFALGTVISPALGGWIGELAGLRSLFFIGAVMAGASSLVVCWIKPQPLASRSEGAGYRGLLSNRRFLGLCGVMAGMWFLMWLGFPLAANFLADTRGMSAALVGALGSFEALGSLALALVLGRQPARRGFLLAHVLVMAYLVVLLRADSFGWFALAFFIRAAAFVARTLAEAQAIRTVERQQWGLAFAVLETASSVGTVLAPLAAGQLYEVQPSWPFLLSLILLPLSVLAVVLFIPRAGLLQRESAEKVEVVTEAA